MTHGQRRGWPSFCLRDQKNTPPVPLAAWVTSGHEKGPRETPGPRRCFSSEPSSSVIHAAALSRWRVLLVNRTSLSPTVCDNINGLPGVHRPKTTSKSVILVQCDNALARSESGRSGYGRSVFGRHRRLASKCRAPTDRLPIGRCRRRCRRGSGWNLKVA